LHSDQSEISWDGLEEHLQALRAFLARRCRDWNQVEDVAQEALLRAARFRSRVQDERNLRGWILRIGSSVLRDHLRRERRQVRIEGADDLIAGREGRENEPGQLAEGELLYLEGQLVERAQLMSEVDLALAEADLQERRMLARSYGADLCRECADGCADGLESEPLPLVRRKERLFRARQRLYKRLTARVRCVVRCGDEFAPARLAATCTGGGALARVPAEPEPGAACAQRD